MSGMTRELHPLGLPRGIALPVDSRLRHVSTAHAMDNGGAWQRAGPRWKVRPMTLCAHLMVLWICIIVAL